MQGDAIVTLLHGSVSIMGKELVVGQPNTVSSDSKKAGYLVTIINCNREKSKNQISIKGMKLLDFESLVEITGNND